MALEKSSFKAWVVCLSAALFFFFGYMQVNVFNALNPYLFQAFHLTDDTQLGRLSSMYFYANVLFLFPAGIILDYVSTRKLILWTMMLTVICTLLFSMTHVLWQAELIRFATGIWGAFFLLSNVRLASRWFPPQKMALVIGVIVTLAMLGAMVAQTPLTVLAQNYGWRVTMLADGGLGVIIFLIMLRNVRDNPPGQTEASIAHTAHTDTIGFWKSLACSLGNTQNWLGGIYASMINLPLFFLGAAFGSMYLTQVYGYSSERASFIITALFLGMIVGSPLMGWGSDRLGLRKTPMVVGAILSLATIMLIMYMPGLGFVSLFILFFIFGFINGSQVIAYPLVTESNPESLTGTAQGITSVLIMSGGLLLPMFPWLLDMKWSHRTLHHLPFYSAADYHLAFMIMPAGFVVALIAALLVRETHCTTYSSRQELHANDILDNTSHTA
ncbi:MAG: MFS transporter [Gammaproteobacteria bacterium]|nr:MFS transporter [Gammaproteobacteria bacterium]MCH9743512.1 MFS transporter [Gammaproteobacteria bacterium]